MLSFLIENLATIVVSGIVLAIVLLIIFKMKRDKKKGGSCSCGSSCSSCGSSSMCNKE